MFFGYNDLHIIKNGLSVAQNDCTKYTDERVQAVVSDFYKVGT